MTVTNRFLDTDYSYIRGLYGSPASRVQFLTAYTKTTEKRRRLPVLLAISSRKHTLKLTHHCDPTIQQNARTLIDARCERRHAFTLVEMLVVISHQRNACRSAPDSHLEGT